MPVIIPTLKAGIDADMKFHNTSLILTPALALFFILSLSSKSRADITQNDAILREKSLIAAADNTDSIKILLDVYNLSDYYNRDRIRRKLIHLASQSDNHEVIGEVIKELSTSTDDADELSRLIEISENLPNNAQNESYKTVLHMEQSSAEAPSVMDSQLKEQITDYRRQIMTLSGDPYKEIQNIYRTMVFLGASSQGAMYYEYIKRLEDVVEALPEDDHAIKNLFYTNAAIFYTRKRDYQKAIEFDLKLIDQLDQIKNNYKLQGKDTADLNYFYYVSNRRMLRNFKGLTPEQIENAFNECLRIAKIDIRANEELGNAGLTKSYYFMATGQYQAAIPELKKALNTQDISTFRKQELLGLLAEALRKTGDKNGELETLREYADMIVAERDERRESMYKEIELRNAVNKVITDEYVEQERQRQENRIMRKTSLTLVYVLAVILIFICGAYFRLRSRVKELEFKNNKLRTNIEHIFDDGVPKGTQNLHHQKNRLKG